MLRKPLIALVASVALGLGVDPGIAAMHGGGFGGGGPWIHGGGFHGGGFHGGGPWMHGGFHGGFHGPFHSAFFRPGFRDHFHPGFRGRFHRGFHDRDFGDSFFALGFAPFAFPYYAYDYGYDYPYGYSYAPYGSCWQPRQVLTHRGWRWREVWVCR